MSGGWVVVSALVRYDTVAVGEHYELAMIVFWCSTKKYSL